jgi:glycosyltransferase involved in cell wall biosynthesis
MPCRDAAAWIDEAVASLAAQSLDDLEVVAVDDASRDDTRARLQHWASRDPRIRVISATGAGIVSALRAGLAQARGSLIARMDADDVAHPDRLAAQVALLAERHDIAACGTQVRYFPAESVRDGARRYEAWLNALTTPEAIARDAFVECPIAHPTLLVRRHVLDAVGGWRDVAWPEDYDLVLRLLGGGHALANVSSVLLDWRERPERLSRVDARYGEEAFRRCKVQHLKRTLLRGRRVVIVGAGPVGKAFARALQADDVSIAAFIDVDPRKIGQTVHGVPVVARDALADYGEAFVVAAVSGPRARSDIRTWLEASGWTELEGFCAVA